MTTSNAAPMVSVPVEPTEAMVQAIAGELSNMAGEDVSDDYARKAYAAMLAAAPAPQPVQGEAVALVEGESGWIDPAKRDNESLVEVTEQLHARAGMYGTKGQHDAWQACRAELLRRLSTQPPAPAVSQTIAAPGDVEQRARELLAVECEEEGRHYDAEALRKRKEGLAWQLAIRAISAALRSQGQAVVVDDATCNAVYDAVTRANFTRDVKTPERRAEIVRSALAQQASKEQP